MGKVSDEEFELICSARKLEYEPDLKMPRGCPGAEKCAGCQEVSPGVKLHPPINGVLGSE